MIGTVIEQVDDNIHVVSHHDETLIYTQVGLDRLLKEGLISKLRSDDPLDDLEEAISSKKPLSEQFEYARAVLLYVRGGIWQDEDDYNDNDKEIINEIWNLAHPNTVGKIDENIISVLRQAFPEYYESKKLEQILNDTYKFGSSSTNDLSDKSLSTGAHTKIEEKTEELILDNNAKSNFLSFGHISVLKSVGIIIGEDKNGYRVLIPGIGVPSVQLENIQVDENCTDVPLEIIELKKGIQFHLDTGANIAKLLESPESYGLNFALVHPEIRDEENYRTEKILNFKQFLDIFSKCKSSHLTIKQKIKNISKLITQNVDSKNQQGLDSIDDQTINILISQNRLNFIAAIGLKHIACKFLDKAEKLSEIDRMFLGDFTGPIHRVSIAIGFLYCLGINKKCSTADIDRFLSKPLGTTSYWLSTNIDDAEVFKKSGLIFDDFSYTEFPKEKIKVPKIKPIKSKKQKPPKNDTPQINRIERLKQQNALNVRAFVESNKLVELICDCRDGKKSWANLDAKNFKLTKTIPVPGFYSFCYTYSDSRTKWIDALSSEKFGEDFNIKPLSKSEVEQIKTSMANPKDKKAKSVSSNSNLGKLSWEDKKQIAACEFIESFLIISKIKDARANPEKWIELSFREIWPNPKKQTAPKGLDSFCKLFGGGRNKWYQALQSDSFANEFNIQKLSKDEIKSIVEAAENIHGRGIVLKEAAKGRMTEQAIAFVKAQNIFLKIKLARETQAATDSTEEQKIIAWSSLSYNAFKTNDKSVEGFHSFCNFCTGGAKNWYEALVSEKFSELASLINEDNFLLISHDEIELIKKAAETLRRRKVGPRNKKKNN